MNKKYIKYVLSFGALSLPVITFAAPTSKTLNTLVVETIVPYLNLALYLMMAFAFFMFVFYVIRYFMMPNEKRAEGNTYVMYSLLGFFVILSFWGLVNILLNSFDLGNKANTPGDWGSFTNIFPK